MHSPRGSDGDEKDEGDDHSRGREGGGRPHHTTAGFAPGHVERVVDHREPAQPEHLGVHYARKVCVTHLVVKRGIGTSSKAAVVVVRVSRLHGSNPSSPGRSDETRSDRDPDNPKPDPDPDPEPEP